MAPPQWPAERHCTAEGDAGGVRAERMWLRTGEVLLRVGVRSPRRASCLPTVVLVPGGLQAGLPLLEGSLAWDLSEAEGVVVYAWDPRGRGESEGTEDANGHRGQDDLAAVLRWVASEPGTDPDRVVVYSRSFGAALAAGALARHPDLQPVAWLDYEGPGWLETDLAYAEGQSVATLRDLAASVTAPDLWWSEREPAGLVGDVTVPYWRAQGYPDHALGSRMLHVLAMLNGAEGSPEVRYNGERVVLPVSEAEVRDAAITPSLDPDAPYLVEMVTQIMDN